MLWAMAAKRSKLVECLWKVHPKLYRWSGGRIGGKIMNRGDLRMVRRLPKVQRVTVSVSLHVAGD